MPNPDNFEDRFCALAERVRATPAPANNEPVKEHIASPGKPTIRLVGSPARMYTELLASLLITYAPDDDGLISQAEVKKRLEGALQDALSPDGQGQSKRAESFGHKALQAAAKLRAELLESPIEWIVYIPLHAPKVTVPVQFGLVKFLSTDSDAVRRLQKGIPQVAEAFAPETAETVARIPVRAIDAAAAKVRGQRVLRHTLDVLDFVSPIIDAPYLEPHAAFESVEAPGKSAIVAIGRAHADHTMIHFFVRPRELTPQLNYLPIEEAISHLLLDTDQSSLGRRLATALAWAGRANVQRRRDQAFLMKIISLESALTSSTSRNGTTERLRLRVVHLLGGTTEQRRTTYERVGALYKMRSGIVHAGSTTLLTDDIMQETGRLVVRVFEQLLLCAPFSCMRTEPELERWFEAQQLAGQA